MSDPNFNDDFEISKDEEYIRLTPKGIADALTAYEWYKEGWSHEEIFDALELDEPEDGNKVFTVRVLIAVADLSGVLDKWEEFKEMDATLEDIAKEDPKD